MALTGMKYPVYAPITTYTEGSAITYGTGAVIAHGISATVTQNHRDNPLYADNTKVENDKGITDYSIELTVDDVSNTIRAGLLGETTVSESTLTVNRVCDANAPYVGFGYITEKMKNSVKSIEAYWFHKTQWAMTTESANTKRDTTEWGTPTLSGTGFGVTIDSSGNIVHYDHANFETEAAALVWLKGRANIT